MLRAQKLPGSTTAVGASLTFRMTGALKTCRPVPQPKTERAPSGDHRCCQRGSVRSTPNSARGAAIQGGSSVASGGIGSDFRQQPLPAQAQVEIVFDGVYMNSDVWLNGTLLGNHPYGYTSFAYDLTPHLKRDGENVVAVRVRNEGRNSRWYSGSGIYRHVWLNTTGEVRVPLWGVAVTTPEVSTDKAEVKVAVRIENRGRADQDATVRIRLLDSKNAVAGTGEARQSVKAAGDAGVEQVIAVPYSTVMVRVFPEHVSS